MRPALIALLALAAASSAAAVKVERCVWGEGICSASAGYVLASLASKAAQPARGPMAERLLRSYALEARCQALRDAKACGAAEKLGCTWSAEKARCAVEEDFVEFELDRMPAAQGCPNSLSAAVHTCAAAKTPTTCASAAAECSWFDGKAPAAARPSNTPAPTVVAAAVLDDAEAGGGPAAMGPDGRPLKGCVPAELARLAAASDLEGLEELNAKIEGQMPEVFGECQLLAEDLLGRCSDTEDRKACGRTSDCAWDTEGAECSAKQSALLSALLGPIVGGAQACHANRNPEACTAAGQVDYEPALAGALLAAAAPKAA
ncbi:hypothetical protein Rsub_08202 [Raphidocelis subcapitata]|uniref:Uncharacterized protein n=1 Tax=Raphidocelis subcapitata TaxID=307507 RepID=A0A2V0P7E9_9CHLO|nr:hypothetical protein Rsub_08202 [Raphidocelis subcapitata]|eukprot:GBF95766.1 hypothetical protein Rsub_08202 [Raphidocelis subcapitata]